MKLCLTIAMLGALIVAPATRAATPECYAYYKNSGGVYIQSLNSSYKNFNYSQVVPVNQATDDFLNALPVGDLGIGAVCLQGTNQQKNRSQSGTVQPDDNLMGSFFAFEATLPSKPAAFAWNCQAVCCAVYDDNGQCLHWPTANGTAASEQGAWDAMEKSINGGNCDFSYQNVSMAGSCVEQLKTTP
jgi:hypothetical protein